MTQMTSPGRAAVRIRQVRREELPLVGRLTLASYDAYGRIEGPYREQLAVPDRRLEGSSGLLVAELDHAVVGTVTYVRPGDREWEGRPTPEGDAGFRVLAVAPGTEGRGVGRALVGACIQRAREDGAHRMVITSMSWMGRAHALYLGLGFVRRPDLDVRFPGGDGYIFALDLTGEAETRFGPAGPVPASPPWFEDVWSL